MVGRVVTLDGSDSSFTRASSHADESSDCDGDGVAVESDGYGDWTG